MAEALRIAGYAAAALAACGIAYLCTALRCASEFRAVRDAQPGEMPGITVLKPLSGLESGLYENLRSFCEQRYERFQIVFGVQRADDPALPVIRRVIDEHPHLDLHLVVAGPPAAGNPKIANVAAMMPFVKHELVIVCDADMRVGETYLRAIAAEFASADVGAVTCLYAADSCGTIASDLGAMGINEFFAPSVLVAERLGPLDFCFGSTMAVRRGVLEAIGGIEALGPHLADDYMLGALVTRLGRRVALSRYVVRNVVAEEDLAALWRHELRWARTIRLQRPAGYAGSVVTYPLPFALLSFAAGNPALSCVLTAAVLGLRLLLHARMRARFATRVRRAPWLVPLRECFGFAVWAASFFGRDVRWRHERLSVDRAGRVGSAL